MVCLVLSQIIMTMKFSLPGLHFHIKSLVRDHIDHFNDLDLNEVEDVLRRIRCLLAQSKIINRTGQPEPTIPASQKHIQHYCLQCLCWACDLVFREISFLLDHDATKVGHCFEVCNSVEVFGAVNETIESLEAGSGEGREDEGEENAKEGVGEAL